MTNIKHQVLVQNYLRRVWGGDEGVGKVDKLPRPSASHRLLCPRKSSIHRVVFCYQDIASLRTGIRVKYISVEIFILGFYSNINSIYVALYEVTWWSLDVKMSPTMYRGVEFGERQMKRTIPIPLHWIPLNSLQWRIFNIWLRFDTLKRLLSSWCNKDTMNCQVQ